MCRFRGPFACRKRFFLFIIGIPRPDNPKKSRACGRAAWAVLYPQMPKRKRPNHKHNSQVLSTRGGGGPRADTRERKPRVESVLRLACAIVMAIVGQCPNSTMQESRRRDSQSVSLSLHQAPCTQPWHAACRNRHTSHVTSLLREHQHFIFITPAPSPSLRCGRAAPECSNQRSAWAAADDSFLCPARPRRGRWRR